MDAPSQPRVFAFAGFRLDPARRRLTGPDGAVIALQPRIFDLLSLLLARPGELLSKQTIMDSVWPDTVVDENNLNQAVSALRRALGETPGDPRFIATVPRRGYQLIVPVRAEAATFEAADAEERAPPAPSAPLAFSRSLRAARLRWARLPLPHRLGVAAVPLLLVAAALAILGLRDGSSTPAPPPPPKASIAVLPFRDLSPAGDQGYFSEGVAEQILDELARLEGLRVAGSLSSSAAAEASQDPRDIGRTLGVAHVLAGGVRKEGDRLRVTAQLISTTDGLQLWSQTYDRRLDDVFAIQDEIAASVAEAMSLTLGVRASSERHGTRSVEAYDHYLRGRAYWAQSGAPALNAAIDEFRRALEIDPDFGPAWASMARAADFMTVNEPARTEEFRALQEEATRRARETAPQTWESIALQARLSMRRWDWTEADEALREADRRARPTPVQAAEIRGVFLMQVGRAREALDVFEAARESDPLSFSISASTAWALDLTGDSEAALLEYAHAETLPGDDTDWAFQHLLRLLVAADDAAIEAHLERYPFQEDGAGAVLRRLAEAWRSPEEALAILRAAKDDPDIEGPHRLDALAVLAARYGDAELALELFRDEFFERHGGATVHLWHPLMSEVRRTEGFKDLVRDLGLVDYWRATGNWADACRPVGADFECG